jgi:hypothetical protein
VIPVTSTVIVEALAAVKRLAVRINNAPNFTNTSQSGWIASRFLRREFYNGFTSLYV